MKIVVDIRDGYIKEIKEELKRLGYKPLDDAILKEFMEEDAKELVENYYGYATQFVEFLEEDCLDLELEKN